jgi:hypothetical protein
MIYSMKYNMASANTKNLVYLLNTKNFNTVKENLENNKKLRNRNFHSKIPVNEALTKIITINKVFYK